MNPEETEATFLERKFAELEKSNAARHGDVMEKFNRFTKKVEALEDSQLLLEEENLNLRFEIQRLRNDVSYLLGKENANNLIVENCHPEEGENSEDNIRNRLMYLFKEVKIPIEPAQITMAKRLGKPAPGKIQPILIKLAEAGLKKVIFPAAIELRKRYKIYVNNDYTRSQREELFHVRETRRALTRNGFTCYTRGFYIFINDIPFNWQAAERLMIRKSAMGSLEEVNSDTSVASNSSKRKISPASKPSGPRKLRSRKTLNSLLLRPSALSQPPKSTKQKGNLNKKASHEMEVDLQPSQGTGDNRFTQLLDGI